MSVDHFWCRLPGQALDSCSAAELGDLVPRHRDGRYDRMAAAGLALGVRRTAVLMELALTENGLHPDPAARLPVYGGARREPGTAMPVLRPEQVTAASAFLRGSALGELVRQQDTVLARTVEDLGYPTPWSEAWAAAVVNDLRELRDFFAAAAAAGDAVVVREAE
ncbi:hypothetical protein BX285_4132 [Streptomyces sp. 1114.5]|uniref:hypothetical protein n=1 Tax=unclassified Streptomyces TaxID=2593676 RepID=UPI000BD42C9E|nr:MULTISPECIES: hypothetical protein [unclassified Streptomyces]RKT19663.1 hypothetical protein BX285_4132 [Streptomyces sp. 1114.5]SOB85860.1 hypothetical protein SAMN06272789_6161 [Streptomyces sp. 1331.2]